jgi:hypothetical protein
MSKQWKCWLLPEKGNQSMLTILYCRCERAACDWFRTFLLPVEGSFLLLSLVLHQDRDSNPKGVEVVESRNISSLVRDVYKQQNDNNGEQNETKWYNRSAH